MNIAHLLLANNFLRLDDYAFDFSLETIAHFDVNHEMVDNQMLFSLSVLRVKSNIHFILCRRENVRWCKFFKALFFLYTYDITRRIGCRNFGETTANFGTFISFLANSCIAYRAHIL